MGNAQRANTGAKAVPPPHDYFALNRFGFAFIGGLTGLITLSILGVIVASLGTGGDFGRLGQDWLPVLQSDASAFIDRLFEITLAAAALYFGVAIVWRDADRLQSARTMPRILLAGTAAAALAYLVALGLATVATPGAARTLAPSNWLTIVFVVFVGSSLAALGVEMLDRRQRLRRERKQLRQQRAIVRGLQPRLRHPVLTAAAQCLGFALTAALIAAGLTLLDPPPPHHPLVSSLTVGVLAAISATFAFMAAWVLRSMVWRELPGRWLRVVVALVMLGPLVIVACFGPFFSIWHGPALVPVAIGAFQSLALALIAFSEPKRWPAGLRVFSLGFAMDQARYRSLGRRLKRVTRRIRAEKAARHRITAEPPI